MTKTVKQLIDLWCIPFFCRGVFTFHSACRKNRQFSRLWGKSFTPLCTRTGPSSQPRPSTSSIATPNTVVPKPWDPSSGISLLRPRAKLKPVCWGAVRSWKTRQRTGCLADAERVFCQQRKDIEGSPKNAPKKNRGQSAFSHESHPPFFLISVYPLPSDTLGSSASPSSALPKSYLLSCSKDIEPRW